MTCSTYWLMRQEQCPHSPSSGFTWVNTAPSSLRTSVFLTIILAILFAHADATPNDASVVCRCHSKKVFSSSIRNCLVPFPLVVLYDSIDFLLEIWSVNFWCKSISANTQDVCCGLTGTLVAEEQEPQAKANKDFQHYAITSPRPSRTTAFI